MSKDNEKKKSNKKVDTKKVTDSKETKANNKKVEDKIKESKATKEEKIIDVEYDYDEDLEDMIDEEKEITEEEIVEEVKEETVRIEEVPAKKDIKKEKIEKIEKIAKEKKKKNVKRNNSWIENTLLFIEKNHVAIYSFIGGVFLTTLVAFIIWPDRIATLKNGEQAIVKVDKKNYTADELYEDMKDYYSVSLLLDNIDENLLTKIYPENDEMLTEVKDNAQYYFDMYEQYYNYTQEQFLEQNGFSSYDAFLEYLKLDYRRNKYLDDYVEKNLDDKEIEEYYDDNVFGDINTQHILVEVAGSDEEDSDKLNDEDAKKLAEEIITKLNDGTSWEDIQKKYADDITFEDLGYQSWDASLEESFMTALEDMEDESYSEEPVKTSYGYHVIYRLDQKDTPSLKKSKEKIIENLITEKKSKDANLLYKALIELRKEKNIKFNDTIMKEKYKEYCDQYK